MDSSRPHRRHMLAVLGAASGAGCLEWRSEGDGPSGDWTLRLEEDWERFDTDRWAVGFIDREDWIPDDDGTVSDDHVFLRDGTCVLEIESEGTGPDGCFQGVINSSVGGQAWHPESGIPIDPVPGQYVEARLQLPGRRGVLPAFWMHPANMNWPPEIDIVELFQRGQDGERQRLNVDVHWSPSGQPGDPTTHEHAPFSTETGIDLTRSFNTYGCAWFADRLEWYFNGQQILKRSVTGALGQSLTADDARPFGLIFSNHVNRIGRADLTEAWTEELVIDWVRVWERER